MKNRLFLVLLAMITATRLAQAADLRASVERFVSSKQAEIFRELVALLSIPNVAADKDNIRKNANHLRGILQRRGVEDGNPGN